MPTPPATTEPRTTPATPAPPGPRRGLARLSGRAPARPPAGTVALATGAGIAGLLLLVALGGLLHHPLLIPPLAASAALVMAAPALPLAQPRNVVGGQLVSAGVGFAALALGGSAMWTAAVAGGAAIGAMALTRTPHSPAAATAVIVVLTRPAAPSFLAALALATVLLVLVGCAASRAARGTVRYPAYWW
ncbi:HPP family protein [Streptomyces sp. 3211.6]|uniref:HPP family protein n=1 Tax=Streptomyces sp. 3211.6 TaxID=1938845 RepID=UPI000EAF53EB|nr:HPP family protein [Streptomyces sp. 3211.6]RKT02604.1 HPP family protein [Streptomyces sp. 3211.6]